MKKRLSIEVIRTLVEAAKPGMWTHLPGLVLAIAKSGSAFWAFRYSTKSGQRRLMTLEAYEPIHIVKLEELERIAMEYRKQVKAGRDPLNERPDRNGERAARNYQDTVNRAVAKADAVEREAAAIERIALAIERGEQAILRAVSAIEQAANSGAVDIKTIGQARKEVRALKDAWRYALKKTEIGKQREEYYRNNPDALDRKKERAKERRKENPDKHNLKQQEYRAENPEKKQEWDQVARNKKRFKSQVIEGLEQIDKLARKHDE